MRKIWIAMCILAPFGVQSVLADEPRKIDFAAPLSDFDGKPFTECTDDPAPAADQPCKTKRQVTLGITATRALVAPEQGMAMEESFKRGDLARRIYHAESLALTVEEIALIKRQIAKIFNPLIVVQTFALLDPASK